MFHIKSLAIVVNNAIGLINHFIDFLYEVGVMLVAIVDFLFAQPFRSPAQDPCWFYYLFWRDVRLK